MEPEAGRRAAMARHLNRLSGTESKSSSTPFQPRQSLLGPRNTETRLNEARRRLRHWADLVEEVMVSPVPFDSDTLERQIEPKHEAAKVRQAQAARLDPQVFDKSTAQGREAKKIVDGLYGVVKAFCEAVEQALVDSRKERVDYLDRQAAWRVAQLHPLDPQNPAQENAVNAPLQTCMQTEVERVWQNESAEQLVEMVAKSEEMDEHIEEVVKEFRHHAPRHGGRRASSSSISPHSQARRRGSSSSFSAGSDGHNGLAPHPHHNILSLGKSHQHMPQLSRRVARIQGVSEVQLRARYGY